MVEVQTTPRPSWHGWPHRNRASGWWTILMRGGARPQPRHRSVARRRDRTMRRPRGAGPGLRTFGSRTPGTDRSGNRRGRQVAVGASFVQRAVAIAMTSPFAVGNARFRYSKAAGPTDTVYLGVFPANGVGRDRCLRYDPAPQPGLRTQLTASGAPGNSSGSIRVFGSPTRPLVGGRPVAAIPRLRQVEAGDANARSGSLAVRQTAPPLLLIGLVLSAVLAWSGSLYGGCYRRSTGLSRSGHHHRVDPAS